MVLVSGSAMAQLIGVLAAPLLSRLYSPEEFGVIGSIMAVVGVISVVSSLKYEMALVIEKDDAKVHSLQVLCWRILLATTALTAVAILSAPWWLHRLSNDETLLRFLPWAIPIVFLTGLYNIYNFRLNRERRYKSLSMSLVSRRLCLVATQVVLGFCGAQALGLVLGNLAGCLVAVIVLFASNRAVLSTRHDGAGDLKGVARKHYRFPAYSAPQNLLNSLSQNLPVYILGYFYGMEVVGAYWFTTSILRLPAALVGQAVRQVFYKEASELIDKPELLWKLYKKTTLILALVIALPVLVVYCWGKWLFVLFFGGDWSLAGEFARWMIFWVATGFVNPPATGLFNVLSKQKHLAYIDLLQLLLRGLILVYGGFNWSAINTIIGFSVVGIVCNIYLINYWVYFFRNNEEFCNKPTR